jgi:hypothetical protein
MWTLGGVRIFVQELPEEYSQTIAELNPINAGTVHQYFGYNDAVIKLKAKFAGEAKKASLASFARNGGIYSLMFNSTNYGNFYVRRVSFIPQNTIYQTFDTDALCTDIVYDVEIELLKNE